jgi:hypothetical protein
MRFLASWMVCGLVGCGGATPKAEAPKDDGAEAVEPEPSDAAETPEPAEAAPKATKNGLPTECDRQDGNICLPPSTFVKKLCGGDYQTVALALFAKGTPWTRAYASQPVETWDASGGGSARVMLSLDEELLVLRHRGGGGEGGIQVSGASGGYDLLRWDGMCVTLEEGQLRFDTPHKPKNPRIIWTTLEVETREKLKEDQKVYDAYLTQKKECKGVTVGAVSKACEKADGVLSQTIADYVRDDGALLPPPVKLPK